MRFEATQITFLQGSEWEAEQVRFLADRLETSGSWTCQSEFPSTECEFGSGYMLDLTSLAKAFELNFFKRTSTSQRLRLPVWIPHTSCWCRSQMEPNIWPSQRLGTAQHALHAGNSWQLKVGRVERDWDEVFSCWDGESESDWSERSERRERRERKARVSIECFLTDKVQTEGRFRFCNGCLSAGAGHYWRDSALLCSSHVKQDEVSCQVAIVNCSGSLCSDPDVLQGYIYTIFNSDCFVAFYILVLCLGKVMPSPATPSWGLQAWSTMVNQSLWKTKEEAFPCISLLDSGDWKDRCREANAVRPLLDDLRLPSSWWTPGTACGKRKRKNSLRRIQSRAFCQWLSKPQ